MEYWLAVALPEGQLRLVFDFCQDRFTHRLELVTAEATIPLATSCEGDEQQAWPPSPPIQHLTGHHEPGGRYVLLGVGMAGQSHWSLSVETDPRSSAIRWDVACRVHQTPDWLGSTYRLWTGAELSDDRWQMALLQSDVEWTSCPTSAAAPGQPANCIVERSAEFLTITPIGIPAHVSRATTVRWCYALQLVQVTS